MSKFITWLGTAKTWVASKLSNIALDGWLHLVAGILITALSVIVFNMGWYAIIPVVVIAILNEVVDYVRYGGFSLSDIAYTVGGGLVVYLMGIVNVLI